MRTRPLERVSDAELWRAITDAQAAADGYDPRGLSAWTTAAVARRLLAPGAAVSPVALAGRLSPMAAAGLLSPRRPAGRGLDVGLWRWRVTAAGRRRAEELLGHRTAGVVP